MKSYPAETFNKAVVVDWVPRRQMSVSICNAIIRIHKHEFKLAGALETAGRRVDEPSGYFNLEGTLL